MRAIKNDLVHGDAEFLPNRDASGTPSERMVVVTVAGKLNDAAFQRAKKAAEFLADAEGEFTANVVSLLPIDYELFVQESCPPFPTSGSTTAPSFATSANPTVARRTSATSIPSWRGAARLTTTRTRPTRTSTRLAETHMRGFIEKTGREYVTMEVCADGAVEGTLLIELFTDIAPKTCANFRAFALGEEEKTAGRTPRDARYVHRVVRDGWFQTGDALEGNGRGVTSVYGDTFADETFKVHHDTPGVLAMAGAKKHTNGCQFSSAQAPLPFLDGRRVGFGRVVDGLGLMRKINAEELTFAERPVRDVRIGKCARFTAGVEGGGTAAEE